MNSETGDLRNFSDSKLDGSMRFWFPNKSILLRSNRGVGIIQMPAPGPRRCVQILDQQLFVLELSTGHRYLMLAAKDTKIGAFYVKMERR